MADPLADIVDERTRQDRKWGQQNHPDGTGGETALTEAIYYRERTEAAAKKGTLTWRHILREEVYEAFAETDPAKLREELIQIAAVAVAWAEDIDRRTTAGEQT